MTVQIIELHDGGWFSWEEQSRGDPDVRSRCEPPLEVCGQAHFQGREMG